jgi:hypothetical protein
MALAIAATAVPLAAIAPPAQAAAPASQEIVIPPATRTSPRQDTLLAGGATGFLHRQEGLVGNIWTDYAGGTSTPVPGLTSLPSGTLVRPVRSESDLLLLWPSPTLGTGSYTLLDPHTGERREMPLPTGYGVRGTTAGKVVAIRNPSSTTPSAGVLLGTEPKSTESLPITLPTGAQLNPFAVQPRASDDQGALISYRQDGEYRFGMLDPTTGVVSPIPAVVGSNQLRVMFTENRIFWWTSGVPTVHWMPRGDLSAQAQEATLPTNSALVAAVGDTLLLSQPAANSSSPLDRRVTAWPLNDGEPSTVLAHMATVSSLALFVADHSAVIVGGSSAEDWGVHRFTEGADGALSHKVVTELPPVPAKVVGLTLYRGTLSTMAELDGKLSLYQEDVGTRTVPIAGPITQLPADMPSSTVRCSTGAACVRAVEGNFYGVSVLDVSDGHTTLGNWHAPVLDTQTPVPGIGGQVRDASDEFVIVDGGSPKKQYIVDPRLGEVTRSRPVQAAAVWYDTLWSASTSAPGTLTAELSPNFSTPWPPSRTVKTGVACVPTELQATARWLYWSCGDGKQAGVYDLTKNHGFTVPSGQSMLGDGYVVRHDRTAGALKLTDFHTGTPVAERTIAALPAGSLPDESRITWAVDKYSGHIAYLDDENRVHVLADGVPDSTPVIGRESDNHGVTPGNKDPYYGNWNATFYLSRPVDSWQVSIVNRISKRQVATLQGGAERGPMYIDASWNGKEPNGAIADSGSYTWELTAKYNGGTVPAKVGSGVLQVSCGRLLTHVYDCDGYPDLLGVRSDGRTNSYQGQSNGTLKSAGITATWPTSSLLVPIGDLNGDRRADMLIRDSKGALRAYWGDGRARFAKTNKYALIGTGWDRYNALTSPGDLTGDGRADLVARDKSGTLWTYAANGKGGFTTRVKIGSNQGGYTMLVGVGDLNGDGRGDMLGRDKSGYLWRLYGNGKGGFGSRVKIASGFNAYNAVIGIGDLTQDGKADLLTRDTKGNVYRWPGNGKGGFGSRVKITSGWNVYKSLI